MKGTYICTFNILGGSSFFFFFLFFFEGKILLVEVGSSGIWFSRDLYARSINYGKWEIVVEILLFKVHHHFANTHTDTHILYLYIKFVFGPYKGPVDGVTRYYIDIKCRMGRS